MSNDPTIEELMPRLRELERQNVAHLKSIDALGARVDARLAHSRKPPSLREFIQARADMGDDGRKNTLPKVPLAEGPYVIPVRDLSSPMFIASLNDLDIGVKHSPVLKRSPKAVATARKIFIERGGSSVEFVPWVEHLYERPKNEAPPTPRPFVPWTEEQMRDGILGMIGERVHAAGLRLKEASKYHTAQYTEQAERDLSNCQRLLAYAKVKL